MTEPFRSSDAFFDMPRIWGWRGDRGPLPEGVTPPNSPRRGAWFACEEPERPTDGLVRWHYEACRGCAVKADALLRQHPSDSHVQWLNQRISSDLECL